MATERRSRRIHSMRASGDRWLFGYADIVTLLFACFASLYVTGLSPAASATPVAAPAPEPAAPAAEPAPVPSLEHTIERRLEDQPRLPGVEIVPDRRGLVISLPEAGSFAPGRAELSPSAELAILDLATEFASVPNLIRVEGHTDDIPIRTLEFTSNWDLSAARATRVVRLLIDRAGLDPARLSAAGYAEHRPRRANTDAASRARNRRVDVVVLVDRTDDGEPVISTDPSEGRP
jgi:chemotaxis protein MotB